MVDCAFEERSHYAVDGFETGVGTSRARAGVLLLKRCILRQIAKECRRSADPFAGRGNAHLLEGNTLDHLVQLLA